MIMNIPYRFLCIAVCAAIMIGAKSMHAAEVPDWVVFPDEEWETASPQEAGHGGGTTSDMRGWSHTMFAWGRVTTAGIVTGFEGTVIGPPRGKKADDGGAGE